MQPTPSFDIGLARADITPADCQGVGMMGWGDPNHRVQGVKLPLHARAVALRSRDGRSRLVICCVELCFVTEAMREEVLWRLQRDHADLGLKPEEIMLTATHTHAAPGGHSRYLLYNITIPDFQPKVFEAYVKGTVAAIAGAFARMRPGRVRLGEGEFPAGSEVAFNRRLEAWKLNPDARAGEEIDRTLKLLRFESQDGKPLGCLNWFSVHATSIHRDFMFIHSDNKGVAALKLEQEMSKESPDFVAIFAQGAAGDVTPNWVKYPGSIDVRGKYREDEKSAEYNGGLQFDLALKVLRDAARGPELGPALECVAETRDFSHVEVDPDFANGRHGVHTGPAAIGVGFMRGTLEGRGVPEFLVAVATLLSRIRRYGRWLGIVLRGKRIPPPWRFDPVQGPKVAFMETGRARVFGFSRVADLFLPSFLHPTIRNLKAIARKSATDRKPFTPRNLPLQIARIGSLALVAVPAELTTVSGKRVRRTVGDVLAESGIDQVILCGYSNAYSGYVTTGEEYQAQAYEGASTHFGMWTLAAYQTLLRRLARRLVTG